MAWAWVRANVHDDDGPWLPVTGDGAPQLPTALADRSTIYFGTGGLALVLAELSLARPLDDVEVALAAAIRTSISSTSAIGRLPGLYFGLSGDATALTVLRDADGASAVLRRILALHDETAWVMPEVPPYDVIAGMAGIAMTGVWCGGEDGMALATLAGESLVAAADEVATGLDWPFLTGWETRMPNVSHGTAGIAAALAITGHALGDESLLDAACRGAAHLVAIGDVSDVGFTAPHYVPHGDGDEDRVTFTWCHGPTGTSLLFAALHAAGVDMVGGVSAAELRARCLRSVLAGGVPERLRPGFWDNDGQCCGTAGVGDVLLDAAMDAEDAGCAGIADTYLSGAVRMGDALVDRAVVDATGARWQFLEHRAEPHLLAPGTGWSQGAAGIASFLLRLARVELAGLTAPVVDRPDTWWAVPAARRTFHQAGA